MLKFTAADPSDAGYLTSVSIRAFHSDIQAGASILKGPPGYDSKEFHEEMIRTATAFYKIIFDNKIIGGFWFLSESDQRAYLYRIFVDPEYHRQSVGNKAFAFLFNTYPWINTWKLKTPRWNTRTPVFYSSLGFKVIKEEGNFRYFEKLL